ncbi:pyrroloquinoline quinone-dependent dehydrogenase [Mesorhizobium sp. SARCC-RB16n]|uniref:pyrroloquinoline quinone-dependent dehydrogenase n=1 Tax=Mesorhizobium sp. SARCC-RB16n TaxID=2116687 RepID=UPI00122F15AA|nr:pyrroloquinoline quinone-dependent dehydrogenase [Mesorhizobium sp. SARCC-RB16n]KAA3452169.1 pyrroloquinoline quinone-dependent dehydrogenase [Mesorhizobium sp. SARCC-RB16n]
MRTAILRPALGLIVFLSLAFGLHSVSAQNYKNSPESQPGGIVKQPNEASGGTSPSTGDAGSPKEATTAPLPAPKPIPLIPPQPTWNSFHGQLNGQKYSPLTQITAANVGSLRKAWELHTGDMSDGSGELPASVWSATPIFANDTLYIGTPFYGVLALDPGTGAIKWKFESKTTLKALTQPALKNRGVAYWESKKPVAGEGCQKIVYLGTMDAHLFALDADTGQLCKKFGSGGVLDVNQWNDINAKYPLSLLQPPTVAGNHVIIGWAGKDWAYAEAPPGTVFSLDPQTGARQWTFSSLPAQIAKRTGTANVWTAMSVDEGLGLVYLPVSSPSPNYWGGNRASPIPLATSTTALDLETGKVVWSRQWVHHDIWDYDINSAPTLMDITVAGKQVPALMQATKMGFLFVVDRRTGKDVWPIDERPVPGGDGTVQGEVYAPTQPFPTKPAPLLDQSKKPAIWRIADVVGLGECSRLWDNLSYRGMYSPPTHKGDGVLAYPDSAGGVQWGGVGFDPSTQTAVVNFSHVVQSIKLFPRDEYQRLAGNSGNEQGYYPQEGAPYGMSLRNALNWLGMPCWAPPFGEIAAIDMTTGGIKWRRPMGASQKWGFYMPESLGSVTIGGPAVTAGGLIFIGGSMDAKVRAYSLANGQELWSDIVQAPAVANPAVYEYRGREYVVFVAGGNTILKDQVGDQVAAYALPGP